MSVHEFDLGQGSAPSVAAAVQASKTSPRVEVVNRNADIPVLYTNNVTVEISSSEVRLRIGIVESSDPRVVRVRDLTHVYMSREHFVSLVNVLQGAAAQMAPKAG